MTDSPQLPEGSVVITPTEMYREMQEIGRKVDHLTSVLDPWQQEINRRIDANRDKNVQLEARITEQATAGYVTGARMWTAVGVLAAVVTALAATAVLILR